MKYFYLFLKKSIVVASVVIFCTLTFASDTQIISGIKNLKTHAPNYFSGGQATEEQFTALAELGVKHVINLRPASETPRFDEASLVTGKGMVYYSLPVDSAADLNLSNVKALDQLLKKTGGEKVFLHCASGNRVGALIALRSALIYGKNSDEAIVEGKSWGLTRLEPEVRRLLKGL